MNFHAASASDDLAARCADRAGGGFADDGDFPNGQGLGRVEARQPISYSGQGFSLRGEKGRFVLPAQFRKTVRESSYNNRVLCLDKHERWNCLVGFGLSRKDLEFAAQLDREEELAARTGKDFDRDDRAQQLYAFDEVAFDDSGRFVISDYLSGLAQIGDALFFRANGSFFTLWNPVELAKMGDTWTAAKAACLSFEADARARK